VALDGDGQSLGFRVQGFDIRGSRDEALLLHQQGIDGLLDAGGPEGMAGQGFGGSDYRDMVPVLIGRAHRLELLDITCGRAGAVGVDVVHRPGDRGECLLHAAHRPLARGSNHIVAVGSGAVTHQFSIDLRAALDCVPQFLHNQHPAATGDDEAVAVGIIGPGGALGGVVVLGRQSAHRVEQAAQGPVQFLAAAGENDILLAELDLLHGIADTVCAGGAGRRYGVIHALDPEGCRQAG